MTQGFKVAATMHYSTKPSMMLTCMASLRLARSFLKINSVIIDPAENRLKDEFKNVKTTYIPQQSIIRIGCVSRKCFAKIPDTKEAKSESNVKPIERNILTFN